MKQLPDEAFALINEYHLACSEIKRAEERKEEFKNKIIALIGDDDIGICYDLKVTYQPSIRETIDKELLSKKYPLAYNECRKQTQFMSIRINHVK